MLDAIFPPDPPRDRRSHGTVDSSAQGPQSRPPRNDLLRLILGKVLCDKARQIVIRHRHRRKASRFSDRVCKCLSVHGKHVKLHTVKTALIRYFLCGIGGIILCAKHHEAAAPTRNGVTDHRDPTDQFSRLGAKSQRGEQPFARLHAHCFILHCLAFVAPWRHRHRRGSRTPAHGRSDGSCVPFSSTSCCGTDTRRAPTFSP